MEERKWLSFMYMYSDEQVFWYYSVESHEKLFLKSKNFQNLKKKSMKNLKQIWLKKINHKVDQNEFQNEEI